MNMIINIIEKQLLINQMYKNEWRMVGFC